MLNLALFLFLTPLGGLAAPTTRSDNQVCWNDASSLTSRDGLSGRGLSWSLRSSDITPPLEVDGRSENGYFEDGNKLSVKRRGIPTKLGACEIVFSKGMTISYPDVPQALDLAKQLAFSSSHFRNDTRAWWLADRTCGKVPVLNKKAITTVLAKDFVTSLSVDWVYEMSLVTDFFSFILKDADADTCAGFNNLFINGANFDSHQSTVQYKRSNNSNQSPLQSLYNLIPSGVNLAVIGGDRRVNAMKAVLFNPELKNMPVVQGSDSKTPESNAAYWADAALALDLLKEEVVRTQFQTVNNAIAKAYDWLDQIWSSCGNSHLKPLNLGTEYQYYMSNLLEQNVASMTASVSAYSASLEQYAKEKGEKDPIYTSFDLLSKAHPPQTLSFPTQSYLQFPAQAKRSAIVCPTASLSTGPTSTALSASETGESSESSPTTTGTSTSRNDVHTTLSTDLEDSSIVTKTSSSTISHPTSTSLDPISTAPDGASASTDIPSSDPDEPSSTAYPTSTTSQRSLTSTSILPSSSSGVEELSSSIGPSSTTSDWPSSSSDLDEPSSTFHTTSTTPQHSLTSTSFLPSSSPELGELSSAVDTTATTFHGPSSSPSISLLSSDSQDPSSLTTASSTTSHLRPTSSSVSVTDPSVTSSSTHSISTTFTSSSSHSSSSTHSSSSESADPSHSSSLTSSSSVLSSVSSSSSSVSQSSSITSTEPGPSSTLTHTSSSTSSGPGQTSSLTSISSSTSSRSSVSSISSLSSSSSSSSISISSWSSSQTSVKPSSTSSISSTTSSTTSSTSSSTSSTIMNSVKPSSTSSSVQPSSSSKSSSVTVKPSSSASKPAAAPTNSQQSARPSSGSLCARKGRPAGGGGGTKPAGGNKPAGGTKPTDGSNNQC